MNNLEITRINELIYSSSLEDNKLGLAIIRSKRKSTKNWIAGLLKDCEIPKYVMGYLTWANSEPGEKYRFLLTTYCKTIHTKGDRITIVMKPEWEAYIKSLK